jgi:anti-sigma factor (TIGR02949 family)
MPENPAICAVVPILRGRNNIFCRIWNFSFEIVVLFFVKKRIGGAKAGSRAMNCEDVQKLLSAYVDGELDAHQQNAIRRHLHQCPRCRLLLEGEQLTKTWLKTGYRPEKAPLALKERLRKRLNHRAGVRRPIWSWTRHPAFALAAVLILLAGVWVAIRPLRVPIVQRGRGVLLYVEHLQGTLDCVNCYLAQKYHVKNYCKEYGHQPALIDEDGSIYLFIPNEILEHLARKGIWHKRVEISGWVLKSANVIELKDVREVHVVRSPWNSEENLWAEKL